MPHSTERLVLFDPPKPCSRCSGTIMDGFAADRVFFLICHACGYALGLQFKVDVEAKAATRCILEEWNSLYALIQATDQIVETSHTIKSQKSWRDGWVKTRKEAAVRLPPLPPRFL